MAKISKAWKELNAEVMAAGEAELAEMLAEELARTLPRLSFALRIHNRYNKLRAARERSEIAEKVSQN